MCLCVRLMNLIILLLFFLFLQTQTWSHTHFCSLLLAFSHQNTFTSFASRCREGRTRAQGWGRNKYTLNHSCGAEGDTHTQHAKSLIRGLVKIKERGKYIKGRRSRQRRVRSTELGVAVHWQCVGSHLNVYLLACCCFLSLHPPPPSQNPFPSS